MGLSRGKRWLLGTAGGLVLLTGLFLWLNRTPSLPRFILDNPHEVMNDYVAGSYRHTPARIQAVNVQSPIDRVLSEAKRLGPCTVDPSPDYIGYYIRYSDPASPVMSIQLTQGRYAWCKSFFYYDRNHPKEFSDGWTVVDVIYRPNLNAWLSSYWEEVIRPRLGAQPKQPQQVLAVEGLTNAK